MFLVVYNDLNNCLENHILGFIKGKLLCSRHTWSIILDKYFCLLKSFCLFNILSFLKAEMEKADEEPPYSWITTRMNKLCAYVYIKQKSSLFPHLKFRGSHIYFDPENTSCNIKDSHPQPYVFQPHNKDTWMGNRSKFWRSKVIVHLERSMKYHNVLK